jgi:hypothetical protein
MLDDLIGGNRWRPIAAAAALVAVGLIAFFTIAGGAGNSHLPTPPHVVSAARSGHSGTSPNSQPDTVTPLESAGLTGCSASVSDPTPPQSATAESVSVTSAAGAQVRMEADYTKTHSVHTAVADPTGKVTFSLPINHASPGVTVPVKVTATLAHTKVTCGSSFTPVGAPALQPLSLFPKVTKLLPGAPTLNQLPSLPPPTVKPPSIPPPSTPPPVTPPPTSPPPTAPPPPPTTTTVPPTTTTTTVPPTTTTTTTVPPTTTTTTTTVPPTTTTTTTVPPTTTTTTTTLPVLIPPILPGL